LSFKELNTAYFLGIGGIGMSAIARFFNSQGIEVSGYDREESELSKELESEGIKIHYKADISQIPTQLFDQSQTAIAVYTPAIPLDFEELVFLKNKGVALQKRAQVLGLISAHAYTIAVAGTHGKTTTSTLMAHVLYRANINFTAFVGGISSNYQTNFICKTNGINLFPDKPVIVVEADEFDRSFLQLHPDIAVITSVDADHLDIYGEENQLVDAFEAFANLVKQSGILVQRHGLSLKTSSKTLTYGHEKEADFIYAEIKPATENYTFQCAYSSGEKVSFELGLPGKHNVENAMAVIAAAKHLGLKMHQIQDGLKSFNGVKRRFEKVFNKNGKIIIDDYAHHPNEIEAIISAVKEIYPNKTLHGIFQPHLFSRTRDFKQGFIDALKKLDTCWLLDIYPAREKPIPGVNSQILAEAIGPSAKVLSENEILESLENNQPDLILTIGAGNDLAKLVPEITKLYESKLA
jgi:UDP-N-acetylmuramate--alanine ligase